MKVFRGVDLTTMPPMVKASIDTRTLLFDGDAAAYKAAATSAKMSTAVNRYWELVLEEMFLTQAKRARVHLTSRSCLKCYRHLYPAAKVYQDNRKGKPKPPLLEELREHLGSTEEVPEGITVVLNRVVEADDALVGDAYNYGDVVISSEDKDLRQSVHPIFDRYIGEIDVIKDTHGWVDITHTPSGASKLTGHGYAFLLAQWLAGDSADNVAGLKTFEGKKVGVVRAVDLINKWGSTYDCIVNILEAYVSIRQNPLAELELLYLRPSVTSCAMSWLIKQLGEEFLKEDRLGQLLIKANKFNIRVLEKSGIKAKGLYYDETDGTNTTTDVDGSTA